MKFLKHTAWPILLVVFYAIIYTMLQLAAKNAIDDQTKAAYESLIDIFIKYSILLDFSKDIIDVEAV